MKKILFVITIIALTLVFPLTAFATDEETATDAPESVENMPTGDEETEDVTLVDRLWEAFTSEKNGILDRAIDLVILIGFAVLAKVASSLKKKVSNDLASLGTKSNEQAKTQDGFNKDFVDGINTLADEIKALEMKLEGVLQDEHAIASLLTVDTTLLEIMTTIYPNAKLPQGIKDIVAEKYANCLKIVNSEDKLGAIINAIHGKTKEVLSNDGNDKEQNS